MYVLFTMINFYVLFFFFFFNDTATTEIYTLSLHDALPILLTPLLQEKSIFTGPSAASDGSSLRDLSLHETKSAAAETAMSEPYKPARDMGISGGGWGVPILAPPRLTPQAERSEGGDSASSYREPGRWFRSRPPPNLFWSPRARAHAPRPRHPLSPPNRASVVSPCRPSQLPA